MAIFLPGPMIADARGSVGGTVFSRNRYGGYVRRRTKPKIPVSGIRDQAIARLTALSTYWTDTLTDTKRSTWERAAAQTSWPNTLGQSYNIGANALFVGANSLQLLAGLPIIEDAPTPPVRYTPGVAVFAQPANGGLQLVSITPAWTAAAYMCLRWALNTPMSRHSPPNKWTDRGTLAVADQLPLTFIPVGNLVTGTRAWLEWRFGDGLGRYSTAYRTSIDVVIAP